MAAASALVASSEGHQCEAVPAETGVSSDALLDPDGFVPDIYVSKRVTLKERAGLGRNSGLLLRVRLPLAAMGTRWKLLRRAPTLAAGLRLFEASHTLAGTSLHVEIDHEPQPAARFGHPNDVVDGGLGAEVILTMAVRCMHRLFGLETVGRVELGHAPRGRGKRLTEDARSTSRVRD
jgi:hypothetical protein